MYILCYNVNDRGHSDCQGMGYVSKFNQFLKHYIGRLCIGRQDLELMLESMCIIIPNGSKSIKGYWSCNNL